MPSIAAQVQALGRQVVACTKHCAGVALNPETGILPRCLYYQEGALGDHAGVIVIGLNPGFSKRREQLAYLEAGKTYEGMCAYWEGTRSGIPYYQKLQLVLDALHPQASVLWTEVVKCEKNIAYKEPPPLQTQRICAATFLIRELAAVPTDWPVLAAGRTAFTASAYLFPERIILGLPHPSGSFGDFSRLLTQLPAARAVAHDLVHRRSGSALWLPEELEAMT